MLFRKKTLFSELQEYIRIHSEAINNMELTAEIPCEQIAEALEFQKDDVCEAPRAHPDAFAELPCRTEQQIRVPQAMEFEATIAAPAIDIKKYIDKNKEQETFSSRLFKFIDESGVKDSKIYKKADIDRRHFSKIRNRDYRPSKRTALALCLALNLERHNIDELLRLAGYSLSNSDTADLVIMFCLEKRIYNLIDVNALLDYVGCKTLRDGIL